MMVNNGPWVIVLAFGQGDMSGPIAARFGLGHLSNSGNKDMGHRWCGMKHHLPALIIINRGYNQQLPPLRYGCFPLFNDKFGMVGVTPSMDVL